MEGSDQALACCKFARDQLVSKTNRERDTAERKIVVKRLKLFLERHTEVCEVGVQGGGIFEMKDPVQ